MLLIQQKQLKATYKTVERQLRVAGSQALLLTSWVNLDQVTYTL